MSQTNLVYDYMKTHGAIDPLTALSELGVMRLGARIWELKAAGVEIRTTRRTNPDTGKRWAEYSLV